MKCDVIYTHAKESEATTVENELKELRGHGFKDEREYLAFLLEQERIWEKQHLGEASKAIETR